MRIGEGVPTVGDTHPLPEQPAHPVKEDKMANNRRRGRDAELEFAKVIGGEKISRAGYEGPDVLGPDGTYWEVKRVKKMSALVMGWIAQMHREGADAIAFREDRGKWYEIREV